MKTILAVLGILLMTTPAWSQNGTEDRPKLSIERTDHNFGEIARGESPSHTFVFRNTGAAELRIINVAPS